MRCMSGPLGRPNSAAQPAKNFSKPDGAVMIQCRLEVKFQVTGQAGIEATHRDEWRRALRVSQIGGDIGDGLAFS